MRIQGKNGVPTLAAHFDKLCGKAKLGAAQEDKKTYANDKCLFW